MKWCRISYLIVIAGVFLILGCTPGARYERMLKKELASGIREDSLFMGIRLGMTDREFYTHCWELNRQGLVRQGSANTTVMYNVIEELDHPATMDFYPEFREGKIVEMPVRFCYNGWAPWNKTLSSDSLQLDVLEWYRDIYGGGFIEVEHPLHGRAYTKVDGNRRITIFRENDTYVWAVFTDLLAKKEETSEPDSTDVNEE